VTQSNLGAAARGGLFVGGILGGIIGLALFGITYLVFKLTNAPAETLELLSSYLKYFFWGGVIIVGFIVGFIITHLVQKQDAEESPTA
jgi:Na+-driven multidrug efflux pump